MIGSFRIERRGACSEIGFDHVGDDGARLGKIERCDRRIHLVETLAATQKLGIDRANLVEHLLESAVIGEKRGDLGVSRVWHIAEARAFAGSGNRGQISLGPVPRPVDAMTTGSTTTLVGFDQ
ncbi:MAG: hypothetical protein WAN65_09160 [Candidatus Sulfotelmatobacter sp.]